MTMRSVHIIALAALASLAVVGCGKKDDAGNKPTPPPTDPVKPDQAKADEAKGDPEVKDHMKEHFSVVREIQDAILRNKLDEAKQKAEWIAEHEEPDVLESWTEHLEVMRAAAKELQEAADVATAAKLSAKLGGECAACHQALTAIATFEFHEQPEVKEGDTKSHMAMHKWAAERLWEGLVGPSESHWTLGAEALIADPLTNIKEPPEAVELAKKVHELGAKAKDASEREERIEIYGELLGTCASCHEKTRK